MFNLFFLFVILLAFNHTHLISDLDVFPCYPLVGEERLRRAPSYDGPHGFEKHSIVLAKLTNTVSRYSQEGTI